MTTDKYLSFFEDCDDNPEFFSKANDPPKEQKPKAGLKELLDTISDLNLCDWCNEEVATIEIITTQGRWFICNECMPIDGEIFPKCQKVLSVSEVDFSEAIRTARNFLKSYRSDI